MNAPLSLNTAGDDAPNGGVRIALLFHSLTSGNLGVGALTIANMAIAEKAARKAGLEPHFVSIGMRDGDSPPIGGGKIESFVLDTRSLFSPAGYWREIAKADCVLDIGAGDSFTDIYAAKRFRFLWLTKAMAIARRVPLVLSPQTIGPFDKPRNRKLAGALMRRARTVVARDDKSFAVAKELAPDAHLVLAADVAFELPYESRAAERGRGKLKVGVNASGLLFHEAESGRNHFGLDIDYAEYTRALIRRLLERGDTEVHLVTHAYTRTDPSDDDARRADMLAKEFPQAIRVSDFANASEVKSYISGLDFLVAGRMHACIGAYSSGTPVLPVAYSRKFSGLFGMLGYRWMVPVKGMDTDAALAFTMEAIEARDQMAQDAAAGMRKISAMLDRYRETLADLFADIIRRRQG